MRDKKIEIWLGIALVITIVLNLFIGTVGVLAWGTAIASIFNLYFTNKRSRKFIVPDVIWCVMMIIIAWNSHLLYDTFQYAYYLIIAPIQFISWGKFADDAGILKPRTFTKGNWYMLILALLVLIPIFGAVEVRVLGNSMALSCMDALNTSLGFVGAAVLARGFREGQLCFLVSNILTAILYFTLGIYPVVITMVLFACCTIMMLPEWFGKHEN